MRKSWIVHKRGRKGQIVHLADESVLVHRSSLLAICQSWRLRPHLLHILEDHVAVAIEGLDASEQLAVVADRNQNLIVGADGGLEDRERSGGELVLLALRDLVLTKQKARKRSVSCVMMYRGRGAEMRSGGKFVAGRHTLALSAAW